MKIMQTRELSQVPFDKRVTLADGNSELAHATGIEVLFEGDDTWWNEYEDSEGNLHYGR